MKGKLNKLVGHAIVLAAIVGLSGCAGKRVEAKSSIVKYLYPQKNDQIKAADKTVLSVPLKVGIAFVPESTFADADINELVKTQLLEKVASHFKTRDYVGKLEIIPSVYLTRGGSFTNLDQLQSMYDIDVIALVSYDQRQLTQSNGLSIAYWTLVGAYLVSGENNDTNTMMDTAVYDISTRRMLFRAPGVSTVKSTATPINVDKARRADGVKSFEQATLAMISNLDQQLKLFRQKIREKDSNITFVVNKK